MRLFLFLYCAIAFISCGDTSNEVHRPKDVWAFRSVLDKIPRMLTLALDSNCYAAYDLANCSLYKVWKGGVDLQGAAYTNKKNVQPVSWGASYVDSISDKWQVEQNGRPISFALSNKGYEFRNNQVYIKYQFALQTGDTIIVVERPEYLRPSGKNATFERLFTASAVPDGINLYISSASQKTKLNDNDKTHVVHQLKELPNQSPPSTENEYDHRGRYYMDKSDCFTCHEVDRQTVGPSFTQVAARYGSEENVGNRLIKKVKEGGAGNWGTAIMNAHPDLTENEIRTMLDYIMSMRTDKKLEMPVVSNSKQVDATPGFGAPLTGVHPSYNLQTIHKADFKPRVGGLAFTVAGKLLVSTWDSIGAVYMMENVASGDTGKITVKRIASGLAEPLGIEVVDGDIYILQKQELTRLIDHDGDDVIDEYETVCNSWGVTGDFHEFAFGLVYKKGYFYATLSMAMRLMSTEKQKPDRGRAIRIAKDGTYEWINYGLRTPNGIGLGVDDEIFVTDNQGGWVPANKLIHIKEGEYHGMRWGHLDSTAPPPVALPAVWLPEDEIGNSPSEPVLINEGIYKGQLLHGDVTYGGIQRDFIEKIDGQYQGAVFRFSQGFEAGINRMAWGPDGALYVGGVGMEGGWSWKEKQYGLQKMVYNGKPVFDILAIRSKSQGFEIEFTEPVDSATDLRGNDIFVQQWWYLPTENYGGPKKDLETLKVSDVKFSPDRTKLLLVMDGLKNGRVVYFRLPQWESVGGRKLWSGEAWYTLNKQRKQR